MHKDPNSKWLRYCAATLIATSFAPQAVLADVGSVDSTTSAPTIDKTTQSPSDFANSFKDLLDKSNREFQAPAQTPSNSASEEFLVAPSRDNAASVENLHATRNSAGNKPQYGKPLADSLDQGATQSTPATKTNADQNAADGSTLSQSGNSDKSLAGQPLAPFRTVGGGFAALHGMQLPRPINIPKDASPELREAIAAIPNGSVVSQNLLRGSQPTSSDLAMLKKAGVRTIVNLRNEEILVNKEALDCRHLGLNFVNIPMALFDNPTKNQFNKFLSTVDSSGPVFVHCQKGEDRTGTMVAVYRIGRENWDATRAYQEMVAMGFKPMLGSLRGGVFAYSASVGRPCPPPAANLGGLSNVMSIIKH